MNTLPRSSPRRIATTVTRISAGHWQASDQRILLGQQLRYPALPSLSTAEATTRSSNPLISACSVHDCPLLVASHSPRKLRTSKSDRLLTHDCNTNSSTKSSSCSVSPLT